MTASEDSLARENAYLRARLAELEGDLVAARAEADRCRQVAERLHGRAMSLAPNPLRGGQ